MLDIVLPLQNKFDDKAKHGPLGSSYHNKIHFNIKVIYESKNKKQYMRSCHKGRYNDMMKYSAKVDRRTY